MEERWTVAAALVSLALIFLAAGALFPPPVSAALPPRSEISLAPVPEGDGQPSPLPHTGSLRLLGADGTVETLELEEYVVGVLAAEMPASFEPAALEAQAVCARTYALRRQGQGSHSPGADVCADPGCCQGYAPGLREDWGENAQAYHRKLRAAAVATAGQVLTQGGQLIDAVFHASSSGYTAPAQAVWGAAVPYLVSVSTPETAGTVEGFLQEKSFSGEELSALLGSCHIGQIVYADWGGVERVAVGQTTLTGAEVRQRLGLRSARFTVERRGDKSVFTTAGYGHGVGMSQQGANLMAKDGAGYETILAHYYPGTVLTALKEEDSGS